MGEASATAMGKIGNFAYNIGVSFNQEDIGTHRQTITPTAQTLQSLSTDEQLAITQDNQALLNANEVQRAWEMESGDEFEDKTVAGQIGTNRQESEKQHKAKICQAAEVSKDMCARYQNDKKTTWSSYDIAQWQIQGSGFLHRKKEMFVSDYKNEIVKYAKQYDIPPELLAGVVYSEFGGDPLFIDDIGYGTRSVLNSVGIGKPADKTSFGNISIQITRVREVHPTWGDAKIIASLKIPEKNIELVAEHLRIALNVDYSGIPAKDMGDEHIRIAGARYNRGLELTKEEIMQNTSYGDSILKRKSRIKELIK
ncbi:hypothetical protein U0021_00125 [Moraxella canis]|uniref:Pesticin C-terminal domain-containing protein n=1 Tax=Moraxella canis TaxID=90239 RepID=A0ABZ0WXS1_9GAMM|nr:lytic transglycosylase domain-containing protein [Moraxella canis]WQE04047.1 hypothetical protein U0021_00125 [Moraxella canis]